MGIVRRASQWISPLEIALVLRSVSSTFSLLNGSVLVRLILELAHLKCKMCVQALRYASVSVLMRMLLKLVLDFLDAT